MITNARTLAACLVEHGYKLQTGGTDTHLVLWDLRPLGLTGSKVEKVCDLLGITINSASLLSSPSLSRYRYLTERAPENSVSGDVSAQTPGGIRLGTAALTSRDMDEAAMRTVAEFLHRAVQLALVVQREAGTKMLKDFVRAATVEREGHVGAQQVRELRREVVEFARRWPLPGVDVGTLQMPQGYEDI